MAKGGMILCFGLLLLGVPDALLAQQKNEANVYWGEYLELLEGEWDQNPALEVLMGAAPILAILLPFLKTSIFFDFKLLGFIVTPNFLAFLNCLDFIL